MASAYLMAGRWSPTRPGVVVLGKADGSIDVWDLTDQSHRASLTVPVASGGIVSMEFWTSAKSGGAQLLAVGDSSGNLHILDIPRALQRPVNNERQIMEAYLDRETRRVEYVKQRMQLHDKERKDRPEGGEAGSSATAAAASAAAAALGAGPPAAGMPPAAPAAAVDGSAAAAAGAGGAAGGRRGGEEADAEEDERAEREYLLLEERLRKQLLADSERPVRTHPFAALRRCHA